MKVAIIAAIGLAVMAGCSGPSLSKNQRAEVENIAEDFADASTSRSSANLDTSNIEERLDQLEKGEKRALDADKVELDGLDSQAREIKELETKLNGLVEHYNDHLKKYHGGY